MMAIVASMKPAGAARSRSLSMIGLNPVDKVVLKCCSQYTTIFQYFVEYMEYINIMCKESKAI